MISTLIKAIKLPNFISIGLLMKSVRLENCETGNFCYNTFSTIAMPMIRQTPRNLYHSGIYI